MHVINTFSLILACNGFNISSLNCRLSWASNTSKIRHNQLECLENACKSDKIKFIKLFCLLAIITNEKVTKVKCKLKKT